MIRLIHLFTLRIDNLVSFSRTRTGDLHFLKVGVLQVFHNIRRLVERGKLAARFIRLRNFEDWFGCTVLFHLGFVKVLLFLGPFCFHRSKNWRLLIFGLRLLVRQAF
jgi:hypothetical protein